MRWFAALLVVLGCSASVNGQTSSKGYIEMPKAEDGAWVLTSRPGSGRNWGTPTFIRYLVMVAREWKRRHPEGPVLRLGDLSKPDGSHFPPHKTHKDGLTADIFTSPKNICHVRFKDQKLTLELAQLMYDYGAKQILYNGKLVRDNVPVARKWPKHDDHFHVVINPKRVPAEGMLLVLPESRVKSGAFIARTGLDKDLTGFEVAWRILGKARLRGYRVLFDDMDDKNGVLHDSELVRKKKPRYRVPVPIEDGRRYRWRVLLTTRKGEVGCGWQTVRADLTLPKVEALSPIKDAAQDDVPTLVWRFTKQGVKQVAYRIEIDTDPSHRRITRTLGPFTSAASSHAMPRRGLKRTKRYHWRVVARDAHGNEGASEWVTFKTSAAFGKRRRGKRGKVERGVVDVGSLNLRRGPGPKHKVVTALRRGTPLRILGEQKGWLEVEARPRGKKPVRGWVSKKFVKR